MPLPKTSNFYSALREPQYRRYFVSSCLSTLGIWITRFLIGWMAWDQTHAALWVGIASACLLFPAIVLSPVFGVLSDRISPRSGLLVTLLSQAVITAIAAGIVVSGNFSLTWLTVLALAAGVISAAHHPLRLALVPRLVSRSVLPSAIGLSAIIFNMSRVLGPALTGLILKYASASVAFLLASLLFTAGFVALLRIRVLSQSVGAGGAGMMTQLMDGLRFAFADPAIRFILSLTLINGLLGRAVIELLPAMAGKLLDGSPNSLATLMAAAGIGSILGGLWVARQGDNEKAMARLILLSLCGSACVLIPIYWISSIWLLTLVIVYLSFTATIAGIGSQTLAQWVVQDVFRGRIMSLWTVLSMGAPALGVFVMGALVDSVGFGFTLIGFALVALVATGSLWRLGTAETQ